MEVTWVVHLTTEDRY